MRYIPLCCPGAHAHFLPWATSTPPWHYTALRRSRAYQRFPELLLEHPNPAESAFRALLLDGIAVRDVDEWEEHYLSSVASMESTGGVDSVSGAARVGGGGGGGNCERMLAGLGRDGCRLAEIDGSAVAIVEVSEACVRVVTLHKTRRDLSVFVFFSAWFTQKLFRVVGLLLYLAYHRAEAV